VGTQRSETVSAHGFVLRPPYFVKTSARESSVKKAWRKPAKVSIVVVAGAGSVTTSFRLPTPFRVTQLMSPPSDRSVE
jgi:hypothetical protein